ncbi:MAG: translesion error-prone DNA polymerase V autoproteolytic subunit [Bacteroidales bacterium]|nr:translesion error-prone DNA polymerase V autoproteolytic subunit [Bacteroidales bacterium]
MEKTDNNNEQNEFNKISETSNRELPLFSSQIPAGFPSPAEDFLEKRLDLNDYLIRNKPATFLVKVHGQSMINAGIFDGDMVVVDRSIEAVNGKIILGVLNGEFTIKRLVKKNNEIILAPENEQFKPIEISPEMDFIIWGVVTFSLHKL